MEFSEKLQELRKQKGLTQDELSEILFVSRTAISKWESGRGYPSIDSLKIIAEYFCITIDDLLSGKELLSIAEKDSAANSRHMRDLVFGLLDCSTLLLLIIPLFGQKVDDVIYQVSLFSLTEEMRYIKISYLAIIFLTVIWGIAILALQNYSQMIWIKSKNNISIMLSIFGVMIFMATLEPYAAMFIFMLLIIKGALLLKRQ